VAAGAFTGILRESGMRAAVARTAVGHAPPGLAGHVPFALGPTAMPPSLVADRDLFCFGVPPAVADVAGGHGVPQIQVGQAALLGRMTTGFPVSPLTPATSLVLGLARAELGDQRFAIPYGKSAVGPPVDQSAARAVPSTGALNGTWESDRSSLVDVPAPGGPRRRPEAARCKSKLPAGSPVSAGPGGRGSSRPPGPVGGGLAHPAQPGHGGAAQTRAILQQARHINPFALPRRRERELHGKQRPHPFRRL
jgi:hypothetical protein